jgi:putative transposase
MYRGEYLAGYAGETVNLRFDPKDITTILVYRQEKNQEVFLTRAHAQSLETEQLALDEALAASRRLRTAGKTITNQSLLQEVLDRDALVATKKSRKERQKLEQKVLRSASVDESKTEFLPDQVVEQLRKWNLMLRFTLNTRTLRCGTMNNFVKNMGFKQ